MACADGETRRLQGCASWGDTSFGYVRGKLPLRHVCLGVPGMVWGGGDVMCKRRALWWAHDSDHGVPLRSLLR